jgi:short-subunit dehydrogenase
MTNTALITGASSGLGLEFAKIHAAKGGSLVLIARSGDKLNRLKAELESQFGISVHVIEMDLSKPNAAKEVFTETQNKGIQIDYLINNAGIGTFGFFNDSDWEKEEQLLSLNILTLSHLTKLYLPKMVEQKMGFILNVASTAAFQPGPLMSTYFASKAYVLHFSEALHNEVKSSGIKVSALCPPATATSFFSAAEMGESALVKGKKLPTAMEVATYGYKSMLIGKSVAVFGLGNRILVSLIGFTPRSLVLKITRKMVE